MSLDAVKQLRAKAYEGLTMVQSVSKHGQHFSAQGSEHTRFSIWRYECLLIAVCFVGCIGVTAPMWVQDRGLVWMTDGLPQHLNAIILVGKQLRNLIRSVIAGEGFVLDQFVFTVGFGADINAVCTIWDPLVWLAAAVPTRYAEWLYYFLLYVRVALSATTFSMYSFYCKRGRAATFLASLCYAFSGYSLFWGLLRHPFFLNPLYVLPLVALGIEKVFNENNSRFFVLSLALSFLLSAYFSYMVCIAVVAYCLIRYISDERRHSFADFMRTVFHFLVSGIAGVAISAPASFPYILSVLSVDRTGAGVSSPSLYSASSYLQMASDAIGGSVGIGGSRRYIGAIALICILVFLCCGRRFEKRERRAWFAALIGVVICCLFPFFGRMFNGFSYVSDRWYFIYDFVIANVVCLSLPVLWSLSGAEKLRVSLFLVPAFVLAALPITIQSRAIPIVCGVVILACTWAYFIVERLEPETRLATLGTGVALLCSVFAVSFIVCGSSPIGAGYASEFVSKIDSTAAFYTTKNPYHALTQLPSKELLEYRYSMPNSAPGYRMNESLNQGRDGMTCYVSLYNQAIDDYRDEMGIADSAFSNSYVGSNSRLALDAFAGAKYFMVGDGEEWRVPATYVDTGLDENDYRVFATEYALPQAFLYDKVIKKSDYDSLSMVQRQEAVLQGCVVEDKDVVADDAFMSLAEIKLNSKSVPFTTVCDDGISITDSEITVSDVDAGITFKFPGLEESETYLSFTNLRYTAPKKNEMEPSGLRNRILSLNTSGPETFTFTVESALGRRSLTPNTEHNFKYCGKNDWVFNCGYSGPAVNELRLTFNHVGTYTYDDLSVCCQPVDAIVSHLVSLKESGLTDISKQNNTITARANLSQDSAIALFTTAYSSGWSAEVDGEPAEVIKGDSGFIALRIHGQGEHSVVLTYQTPGLRLGMFVCILGLIGCVGIRIGEKRTLTEAEDSRQAVES